MRLILDLLLAGPIAIAAMSGSAAAASTDVKNQNQTVTVQAGDNLSSIAGRYSTTYLRLFDANANISDPNIIFPGQSVTIPSPDEQLTTRLLPSDQDVAPPEPEDNLVTSQVPITKTLSAPKISASVSDPWGRLAACESSGNWATNTGNGFYGGLQFTAGTWLAYGGGAYAPTANLATPGQQIDIASRLQGARGWSPWPACSARLGL